MWWAGVGAVSDAQLAWLRPAEHERRERFRREADRERFATATVVLRSVLGAHLGVAPEAVPLDRSCERCGGNHGRPRLPGTGYAVSIAHAGDWVAVACGRVDAIGVDVEAVGRARTSTSMTRLVLAPAEREDWSQLPDGDDEDGEGEHARAAAFAHYWTAKEAVLKATGDGLQVPMSRITISPPSAGPPTLHAFAGRPDLPARLRLTRLNPRPGYAAALATIANTATTAPTTTTPTEHDATPLLAPSTPDVPAFKSSGNRTI